MPAPEFRVNTFDGKAFALRECRGRVVLLYFWATWCGPCVASTPKVKKLHAELSERDARFSMLSMSLDRDEAGPQSHVRRHGLSWPQARLGPGSQVAADYGVTGIPAYFLIDPEGKIAGTNEDSDGLKESAARLLPGAN